MQRNQLELQLKNYLDFISICPSNGIEKLVAEMMKIQSRLDKLKSIDGDELMKKVDYFFETKQSKLNFKTLIIDD